MARPSPGAVLTTDELDELARLVEAGSDRDLQQKLAQLDIADRLRTALAAGLGAGIAVALSEGATDGAGPTVLQDVDLLGDSFGISRFARARNTARLIRTNLLATIRTIKAGRQSARDGWRPVFRIGPASSSETYRDHYQRLVDQYGPPSSMGPEALAKLAKLREAELQRVLGRALQQLVGRRTLDLAGRYLQTEYDGAINQLRVEGMKRRGYQFVQIVAQPGYCSICSPHAFKIYPINYAHLPPYHPNCRCRPWAVGNGQAAQPAI